MNTFGHWKKQAKRMKILCACGEMFENIKLFWKHQNGRQAHSIQKFRAEKVKENANAHR